MDALYARQSVDKKDSISIEAQINFCKSESDAPDGYMIFKDKGFSGKNTNRPDFQRMLHEVRNGKIKKIIVYKMDRFSRSILDFSETWDILQSYNVEFVSINEKFDTGTPMGRAMLFIIMVFAQLERETISERCVDNYYERIKRGVWPGGPAPFGFQNGTCRIEGKNLPTLIEDSDLQIMIDNFNQYKEENMSLGKLAKKRIEQNIQTNQKIVWNNISLSRLLRNPVYVKADILVYMYLKEKGFNFSNPIEEWDGTRAAHVVGKKQYQSGGASRKYTKATKQTVSLLNIPGRVDSQTWLACNRKLDKNGQIKNSGAGKHTWLTGLIKCGNCGYAIRINTYKGKNKTIKYMKCSGRINLHCCNVINFDLELEQVEQLVEKELNKILELSKSEELEEVSENDNEEKKITLAKIEERIDRLIRSIGDATQITMKYINQEIAKLDLEKKEIMDSLQNGRTTKKKIEPIVFSNLKFEEKKKVAQNYIKRIMVFNDKIDIIWKI